MASCSRNRNYCFTLNNYIAEDIDTITQAFSDKKAKYIFQEETGKEGTPHLQGSVFFENAMSFNKIKKILPKAHIEICKNKMASINYCQKGETRTGEIYTNMDIKDEFKNKETPKPLSQRIEEEKELLFKEIEPDKKISDWKELTRLFVLYWNMEPEVARSKAFKEIFIE